MAKIEIDAEAYKDTVIHMFKALKNLETELLAYRLAIHMATELGLADPITPWEATVAAAKENPAVVQPMAAKYDPIVQELLTSIDLADTQGQVLELLRQWKPTGPAN